MDESCPRKGDNRFLEVGGTESARRHAPLKIF